MVFIPPSELPTSFDIPALTDLQHRAETKYNADQWLAATAAETWSVPGCERITGVFGDELIKQAGLDNAAGAHVLDLGTGMGQITQSLQHQSKDIQVVAGDIDESYLDVLRIKKEAKGWDKVEVRHLDATAIDMPDNTFTHVIANFVYFLLLKDPKTAIKDSIRVLKPGGTLGFTTWAHNGAFYLLQHAQTLIPDAPNTRTPEISAIMSKVSWHDRTTLTDVLVELGMEDIQIELADYKHVRPTPAAVARDLWVVTPPFTFAWGPKRQTLGWKLFEAVEEVLRSEEMGNYGFRNVALIITAKKPL